MRHKQWPTQQQFEQYFKDRFKQCSQFIQAIIAKFFDSSIDCMRTQCANGGEKARSPWKNRKYKTVPWKGRDIRADGSRLRLPMPHDCKANYIHLPDVPKGCIAQ